MAKLHTIDWVAPTCMLASLLVAVAASIGHHLFYSSLDGTIAPDTAYAVFGASISKQQFNIAVGTALAFCFKAALVLAVSIAFIQAFWQTAKTGKKNRVVQLGQLDSTYSALNNLLAILNPLTWWRHPLPLLVAVVAWLTPVASIITPATLSIQRAVQIPYPTDLTEVPNLDFASLNFLGDLYGEPVDGSLPVGFSAEGQNWNQSWAFSYGGPSLATSRSVDTVMSTAEIQPIKPPALNASWNIEFFGPEIKCGSPDPGITSLITANLAQATFDVLFNASSYGSYVSDKSSYFPYISWVTSDETALPFAVHRPTTTNTTTSGERYYSSSASLTLNQSVQDIGDTQFSAGQSLFVVTAPGLADANNALTQFNYIIYEYPMSYAGQRQRFITNSSWMDANVIQCRFYNTSYMVGFHYTDGTQRVRIDTRDETSKLLDDVPLGLSMSSRAGVDPEAFDIGQIETTNTGVAGWTSYCQFTGENATQKIQWPCVSHSFTKSVQLLSFQAVLDAFVRNVLGSVAVLSGGLGSTSQGSLMDSSGSAALQQTSRILNTALAQTPEMTHITANHSNTSGVLGFRGALSSVNIFNRSTIANAEESVPRLPPLGDAIEQMFRDVTISLLSSPSFRSNYSAPFAPQKANVTFFPYHNYYIYTPLRLWIAYGAAIFLATIAVITGLVIMLIEGASYSDSFSTMVRIGQGARLDTGIRPEDLDGRDPLPKYLARACVNLSNHVAAKTDSTNLSYNTEPRVGVSPSEASVATRLLDDQGLARDGLDAHGGRSAD